MKAFHHPLGRRPAVEHHRSLKCLPGAGGVDLVSLDQPTRQRQRLDRLCERAVGDLVGEPSLAVHPHTHVGEPAVRRLDQHLVATVERVGHPLEHRGGGRVHKAGVVQVETVGHVRRDPPRGNGAAGATRLLHAPHR